MRFDDRLLTVLNQPAGDRHDIAVRWRQLVDLVARAGASAGSPKVAQALDTIRADAADVDEQLRAAAARAVAALPLPLSLLEYFAGDRLSVSAPVLAAATLEPGQWTALLNAADDETRRFIETLHPEIRESAAEVTDEPVVAPPAVEPSKPAAAPSLHEVVERIERRRRARALHRRSVSAGSGEAAPSLFRWESGPGGEIAWVEGVPRGAMIGRSIARAQPGEEEAIDPQVTSAFMMRTPFRDAALTFASGGPLAGEWKISGVPAFEPADGRFAGYRGIALRERPEPANGLDGPDLLGDPDAVRELVHEIKTPLNAIMGFAEIIEGQYLGPAEGPYRERAGEIVRQAALLLTAIDDLDFAARVQSSGENGAARVNLGVLIEHAVPTIRQLARSRDVEIDASRPPCEMLAGTEAELAERLIHRLCSAVVEQGMPGERLRITLDPLSDRWRFAVSKPALLKEMNLDALLAARSGLDAGFPLRLVHGLAKIVGAEVSIIENAICLDFRRA